MKRKETRTFVWRRVGRVIFSATRKCAKQFVIWVA